MSPGWRWKRENNTLAASEHEALTEWGACEDLCFVLGTEEPVSWAPWQE